MVTPSVIDLRSLSAVYLEEYHEKIEQSGNADRNRRHGNGRWRPDH
jgi:hypothetical protein